MKLAQLTRHVLKTNEMIGRGMESLFWGEYARQCSELYGIEPRDPAAESIEVDRVFAGDWQARRRSARMQGVYEGMITAPDYGLKAAERRRRAEARKNRVS
jgi:hypothetical protein